MGKLPTDLSVKEGKKIAQGYLAVCSDGTEVRVRSKGNRYFLTIKGVGSLTRMEREIELQQDQFNELWPATSERRIEKTRHELKHGEHTIELDIYHGNHHGLMIAEIEFTSEASAKSFTAPAWFGPDVTEDSRFKNKNLACQTTSPTQAL